MALKTHTLRVNLSNLRLMLSPSNGPVSQDNSSNEGSGNALPLDNPAIPIKLLKLVLAPIESFSPLRRRQMPCNHSPDQQDAHGFEHPVHRE